MLEIEELEANTGPPLNVTHTHVKHTTWEFGSLQIINEFQHIGQLTTQD